MKIITTIEALRAATAPWRLKNESIGFVPTMGALHEGHASLVRESVKHNAHTIVSVFVNPTQFGVNEDLARYPSTPAEDEEILKAVKADILYRPDTSEIYPEGFATSVRVKGIPDHLCGPFRPGHFDGVATVVAKLLNQANAANAYFGEKDWQQLQVIKRLQRDLDIPTNIIGVPTVREVDGLALSSRNRYLSSEERVKAASIPRIMKQLALDIKAKPDDVEKLLGSVRAQLESEGFRLDYLELAGADDCASVRDLTKPARLFIAARLGKTRLIDNWAV